MFLKKDRNNMSVLSYCQFKIPTGQITLLSGKKNSAMLNFNLRNELC